jgi:hypothetical protein
MCSRITLPRLGWLPLAWLSLAWLSLACGHPATEKECQEIADRVTELELRASPAGSDPETAKEQLERTRIWVKEGQLKACVGRRITNAAMECVRAAKKAEEITDDCFR